MDEDRLTALVPAGGCARKLPAEDLAELLSHLAPFPHAWVDPEVGPMEDAAIVCVRPPVHGWSSRSTSSRPSSTIPRASARIAAANAISDVYAMGGEPQVALAVCGVPRAGCRRARWRGSSAAGATRRRRPAAPSRAATRSSTPSSSTASPCSGTLAGAARSPTSTRGRRPPRAHEAARCRGGLASAEAAAPAPRRARAGRGRDDDPEPRGEGRGARLRGAARRPTSRASVCSVTCTICCSARSSRRACRPPPCRCCRSRAGWSSRTPAPAAASAISPRRRAGPASRPESTPRSACSLCDAQTSGGPAARRAGRCGVAPARRARTPRHARARGRSAS